jgi:cytidylate kinase
MSIVIVGPCAAGKSSLATALRQLGFDVRTVAQEHSVIPKLWAHGGEPSALIFLDASPATIAQRRHSTFPDWLYRQQHQRLRSARRHATIYLQTDRLSVDDVRNRVLRHLRRLGIQPSHVPQAREIGA